MTKFKRVFVATTECAIVAAILLARSHALRRVYLRRAPRQITAPCTRSSS